MKASRRMALIFSVAFLVLGTRTALFAQELVQLNVYMGWDATNPAVHEVIEAYIAEYEALNPHVRINNLGSNLNADAILTQIIGGVPPDVVKGGMTMIMSLYLAGVLDPVPEPIAEQVRETFFPVAVESVTVDGKLIAIPMEGNSTALMVNQRRLHEKGVAEVPPTWDEFAEVARRITEYDSDGNVATPALVEPGVDWSMSYFVLGMLKAEGAQLIDAEGNLGLATPAARRAVERLTSAIIEKPFLALGWNNHSRFTNGEIPFGLAYPWWYNGIVQSNQDVDTFRTTLIPAGSQGYGSAFYSHGYAVPESSENRDEAWRFLAWLATNEKEGEGTPLGHIASRINVLPITRTDLTSIHFSNVMPQFSGFTESLNHATHPSDILRHGLTNWPVISRLVLDVATRGVAPASALENVITQLSAQLAAVRKN